MILTEQDIKAQLNQHATRHLCAPESDLCISSILCRQPAASGSRGRDFRKLRACVIKLLLGGNKPEQSHISCHPRSTLKLEEAGGEEFIRDRKNLG